MSKELAEKLEELHSLQGVVNNMRKEQYLIFLEYVNGRSFVSIGIASSVRLTKYSQIMVDPYVLTDALYVQSEDILITRNNISTGSHLRSPELDVSTLTEISNEDFDMVNELIKSSNLNIMSVVRSLLTEGAN